MRIIPLLTLISGITTTAVAQSIDQNTRGDCNSAVNAQGNVTIECNNSQGGDADFIFDATHQECVGMDRQFTIFFDDAVEWKRLRSVALPRMSNGVLQEIVRNNKVLYKKKSSEFLQGFRSASDIPHLLDEIKKDQIAPFYSYDINEYLKAIQSICKWADVNIDLKSYVSKYEKEVFQSRK